MEWRSYISYTTRKCIWTDPFTTEETECIFHQFGCDYEEFEYGVGNFTTAVIELPDGTVKIVCADQIRFIIEEEK
jgi:hypothetical protein